MSSNSFPIRPFWISDSCTGILTDQKVEAFAFVETAKDGGNHRKRGVLVVDQPGVIFHVDVSKQKGDA